MNEPISTERQALMSDAVERRETLRDEYARHDEETDGTVGGAVVGRLLDTKLLGDAAILLAMGLLISGVGLWYLWQVRPAGKPTAP